MLSQRQKYLYIEEASNAINNAVQPLMTAIVVIFEEERLQILIKLNQIGLIRLPNTPTCVYTPPLVLS